MKKQSVAQQRREIFMSIYGVKTFSEILGQFETDYNKFKNRGFSKIQELYGRYSYAIFFMYSPSSIRNNLVKFKNVIKANGGKYQANAEKIFTIDAVYAPIKQSDLNTKKALKADIDSGNSEAQNIDPTKIIKDIEKLKEELENKTYVVKGNQKEEQVRAYILLPLLGLSTGRRFTEILKTLVVYKAKGKVMFKGLLKGNSDAIEGNIIGLSYQEIQGYLKELRAFVKTDSMTINEVNSKYAKVFNNNLKRKGFKNVKATRHNYSVAGSQLFKRDNESVTDTITRILGHKEVFVSALNYT